MLYGGGHDGASKTLPPLLLSVCPTDAIVRPILPRERFLKSTAVDLDVRRTLDRGGRSRHKVVGQRRGGEGGAPSGVLLVFIAGEEEQQRSGGGCRALAKGAAGVRQGWCGAGRLVVRCGAVLPAEEPG